MRKVKAIIPEGEAVQLQFENPPGFPVGLFRIKTPVNAPEWYLHWAADTMRQGCYERLGFIPLYGRSDNHWMTGAKEGDWIIRGNDGQIMALPPTEFSWFYEGAE